MNKEYEGKRRIEDFISVHEKILPEIVRVTKPGGSICWQVGYYVRDGAVTPLDFWVHSIMQKFEGITLRNRIVWTYGHGLHCSNRFSGRHEVILWYTKDADYEFNLDAVRVPQKYPGKRYFKGLKKGEYSGNPLGKNPTDVWEIPNVKANHLEKTKHPCQFPVSLALRLIRALSGSRSRILDPFLGSGTTAVAAILEKRRFVGAELNKRYHKIATARCREAIGGTLRYRPPEQEVYKPVPNTDVATAPQHFAVIDGGLSHKSQWQSAKRNAESA
jgi:adenine-specific DNA-methyltransferase